MADPGATGAMLPQTSDTFLFCNIKTNFRTDKLGDSSGCDDAIRRSAYRLTPWPVPLDPAGGFAFRSQLQVVAPRSPCGPKLWFWVRQWR